MTHRWHDRSFLRRHDNILTRRIEVIPLERQIEQVLGEPRDDGPVADTPNRGRCGNRLHIPSGPSHTVAQPTEEHPNFETHRSVVRVDFVENDKAPAEVAGRVE